MSAISISKFDKRYIDRHINELDMFEENDSDSWRAYIDTKLGRVNHHSRSRIKSALYDWRAINEWMTEHRMSNTNFCIIFELHYGRHISVGAVANIRSGHYTGAPMIEKVEALIYGERVDDKRRTA
ncbi:MAG: hypothetical protein WC374_14105 [Phycisphaerae bacterium]|jgi:hypothetical protein